MSGGAGSGKLMDPARVQATPHLRPAALACGPPFRRGVGPVLGPILGMTLGTMLGMMFVLVSGPASAAPAQPGPGAGAVAYTVVGDGIPQPLTATPGDARRGRALVADRRVGLCLLCHTGPIAEERAQGNLAPPLDGAGARWTAAQLRLRVADNRRLNPVSLMPAFHRSTGLHRVGSAWQGRPVLDAQQVEDVVAYLGTLQ